MGFLDFLSKAKTNVFSFFNRKKENDAYPSPAPAPSPTPMPKQSVQNTSQQSSQPQSFIPWYDRLGYTQNLPSFPKPQQQQPQANVQSDYLKQMQNSARQRTDFAKSSTDEYVNRLNQAKQSGLSALQSQIPAAQQGFDKFKSGVYQGLENVGQQVASSKDYAKEQYGGALRQGAEGWRQTQGGIQNLFAKLGTPDSSAFQNMMVNKGAEFSRGQQSTLQEQSREMTRLDSELTQARIDAEQLINQEAVNLQNTIASIQGSIAQGTLEYDNAIADAYANAQNKIYDIQDQLAGFEYEVNLKTQELQQQDYSNLYKSEAGLRGEFEGKLKESSFVEVANAYEKILNTNDTAAGDLSLIFSYMKMLDPGSVVREGEFANAQNTAGIPDRIRTAYNNALKGERLAPNQRSEFKTSASSIYQAHLNDYNKAKDFYSGLGNQQGLSSSNITGGYDIPQITNQQSNPNDPLNLFD